MLDPLHHQGPTAVFMDFENLVMTGGGRLGVSPATAVVQHNLALLCRGFGNAAVRRAYANWRDERFGRHERLLLDNGMDLVQMGRVSSSGHKNAADIRVVVDVMETLMSHPEIEVYVIVTGDSDFTPLVHRLREFGKHVVGVGTAGGAGRRLASVCSEYRYWEDLLRASDHPRVAEEVERRERVRAILLAAFESLSADRTTGTDLKQAILALDPDFQEKTFGVRGFRNFLDLAPEVVAVRMVAGGDMRVQLARSSSS